MSSGGGVQSIIRMFGHMVLERESIFISFLTQSTPLATTNNLQ